ncbi:hypothetical protein [Alicyclobacillus dauci]|uniref:Spore coat protein B n=1 Tax=Alicyclobacillus dauci TaxID=1475485 RepID=A0ABY6Z930_9BACL|nr:hypothetical protein [Alicyclobacillus dauci]WAH36266.1 hypothetical protein NZD86_18825 [Alicyclobacillus dauci]WAH39413.1 hypothetical protein NZD86_23195 [Alicyclobacillus dauci]
MRELLRPMVGTHILLENKHGLQHTGVLSYLGSDYLSLMTADYEVRHVPYRKIKSVITDHTELAMPQGPGLDGPDTFQELLESMHNKVVKVDSDALAKTGILSEIDDRYISMLLDMKHMVHYRIRHITSFSEPVSKSEGTNSSSDSTDSSKSEQTSSHSDKSENDSEVAEQKASGEESQVLEFSSKNRSSSKDKQRHDSKRNSSEKNDSSLLLYIPRSSSDRKNRQSEDRHKSTGRRYKSSDSSKYARKAR